MPDELLVNGSLSLDERMIEQELVVTSGDEELWVQTPQIRRHFKLKMFVPQAFYDHDESTLRSRVEYLIQGSDVAELWEQVGHPGENDIHEWEFQSLRIAARFSASDLSFGMSGNSEPGRANYGDPANLLPCRRLVLRFQLPRAEFQRFLQLSDAAWSNFERRLDSWK